MTDAIKNDWVKKVEKFNETYGLGVQEFEWSIAEHDDLLVSLIQEELSELKDAASAADTIEVMDALGDLAYVVVGAAVRWGIDITEVFNRVHTSNMSKLGVDGKPIFREDGKLLKGPNFREPDFSDL